ncbi:hypothetical protein E5843_00835 [Luteimonas yindakuii]|uniref:hypothetical protein n=1 Tax=Luteimonas yindakuii TaxID=2565782 RepID=UPI0010A4C237|nr:hypothetical protein [Luteimonas yindakuii]QCO66704.1 hypothetical protein E5843_00835 [Luteimonas yindakuii]
MSRLQKVHVAGAGIGAIAAGFVMGGIGYLPFGVPGLVVGVVIGAAIGAIVGHRSIEAIDPRGDLGHFQQVYRTTGYYADGMAWDDYAPAYQLGLDTFERRQRDPDLTGAELEARWPAVRGGSRLEFAQAYPAVQHVWRELGQRERALRDSEAGAPRGS